MKFAAIRPYTTPEAAARKLIELVNAVGARGWTSQFTHGSA
jgi:hypothetical protein